VNKKNKRRQEKEKLF